MCVHCLSSRLLSDKCVCVCVCERARWSCGMGVVCEWACVGAYGWAGVYGRGRARIMWVLENLLVMNIVG